MYTKLTPGWQPYEVSYRHDVEFQEPGSTAWRTHTRGRWTTSQEPDEARTHARQLASVKPERTYRVVSRRETRERRVAALIRPLGC